MAWVPKYFHDVFLSYAHADNEGRDEWVGSFKTELEYHIQANLGSWGDRRATVWWDEHRMRPGDSIRGSIIDALNRSATLVSLCSPNYLGSGYCMEERVQFERACDENGSARLGNTSRLLNAILRPSDDVFQFARGPDLFADFSSGGVPLPVGSVAFNAQVGKLASVLSALLKALWEQFPPLYVSLPVETGNDTGQNTIDMLRSLSAAGYRRTSERHPLGLSNSQLAEEIHGALLSVHIVDDPEDALTGRQIDTASQTGRPMVVWLSESARKSRKAEDIRKSVASPGRECWEGPFAEFRDYVQKLPERIKCGEWPKPERRTRTGLKKIGFLYNNKKEHEDAAEVRRRLEARFEVTFAVKPTDDVDGVLVYQKEAGDLWFEDKLRQIMRMKGVKAAWPIAPPSKNAAMQVASQFEFRPLAEFDSGDQRLLLSKECPDPLRIFIDLVNGSPVT
jgi:hypothetical protein